MKKTFSICLMTVSFCLGLSADWQDDYAKGLESISNQNLTEAAYFLEKSLKDPNSPEYVKIDYAQTLMNLDRYEESIHLTDELISHEDVSISDKSKAYGIRAMAKACLNQNDFTAMDDLRSFGKLNPCMPKMERGKYFIVIKNAPKAECYRKIMTCYLIHTGQCRSKKDIKRLPSGDWIIKKQENCGCGCKKDPFKCDECGMEINYGISQSSIKSCKGWCDRIGIAAMAWCTKVFKNFYCQIGCQTAVFELTDGCYWCCEDGDFYGKCIKPFNEILAYMSPGCAAEVSDAWDE